MLIVDSTFTPPDSLGVLDTAQNPKIIVHNILHNRAKNEITLIQHGLSQGRIVRLT